MDPFRETTLLCHSSRCLLLQLSKCTSSNIAEYYNKDVYTEKTSLPFHYLTETKSLLLGSLADKNPILFNFIFGGCGGEACITWLLML